MVEWPGPPLPEDAHQDHALYWRNVKGGLFEEDFFWREHQRWLADAGYMLRPRYREDWQPSWLKSGKATYQCEDGKSILVSDDPLMLPRPTDRIPISAWIHIGCHSDIRRPDRHYQEGQEV